MKIKENQRITLTKRLVNEAFLKLLRNKDISKITIRELCEKAGINRSTFYAHYGSQYDVLSEITDQYLAEIEKAIENADTEDQNDIAQRVTIVLRYAENNLELSRLLMNHNIDPTFGEKLVSLQKIQSMLSAALSQISPEKRGDYIAFTVSGSYRLIQDWINAEQRTQPKQEAELILTLARLVCTQQS